MTSTLRHDAARVATLAAAAAAIALGSLAVAAPASAHDQLVASDPVADATIDTLPEQLTLVYSGELIYAEDGTAVQVLSPSGEDVAGSPTIDGTDVDVPLTGGEAGDYEVTWRVVSNDGHPIDGTFSFSVENSSDTSASDGDDSPGTDGNDSPGTDADDAEAGSAETDGASEPADESDTAQEDDDAAGSSSDASAMDSGIGTGMWIALGGGVVVVIAAVVVIAIVTSRRKGPPSSGGGTDSGDERP
ncbi:copper resistance CopC family protein [Microbacterium halotolerans]|uniref:copper resistance CopC family protein n=1 Tax=Microbacterium halotolerans TaxID=246613 RepID=UPI0013C35CFF|nr:copper resistance CopC family protein [Microbacterium halotolerans]